MIAYFFEVPDLGKFFRTPLEKIFLEVKVVTSNFFVCHLLDLIPSLKSFLELGELIPEILKNFDSGLPICISLSKVRAKLFFFFQKIRKIEKKSKIKILPQNREKIDKTA